MTNTDRNWWKQKRARGYGSFILREGILRYGTQTASSLILCFVAMTIFFTTRAVALIPLSLSWIVFTVVFGTLIGHVLWRQYENDYQNRKTDPT